MSWIAGLEHIELRVDATDWHGGTVTIDGPEFIDSDPYAGPPDPQVVVEPRPGGHRLLTFGLPAEGIHVELEVDASYRIVHETLAAPKHLAKRTFSYPR